VRLNTESGLVVNAGIYIVTTWRRISCGSFSVKSYVRSYSHKILPITLTLTLSILGLIPFLFDGLSEPFWFSFAVGTIAGLAMSSFAVIFVLPIFAVKRR
jgi:multidrug efflux pump subunit AcrB